MLYNAPPLDTRVVTPNIMQQTISLVTKLAKMPKKGFKFRGSENFPNGHGEIWLHKRRFSRSLKRVEISKIMEIGWERCLI